MVMPCRPWFSSSAPPKTVIRAAIARLSSPPADHNLPGLPVLTDAEVALVEGARSALATHAADVRALDCDSACAQDAGGQGPPHGRSHFRPPMRARGVRQRCSQSRPGVETTPILERLPAVEGWRATLTDKQRFKWASPKSVLRYCPLFAKPKLARAAIAAYRADRQRRGHRDGSGRHVSCRTRPRPSSGPGWPSSRRDQQSPPAPRMPHGRRREGRREGRPSPARLRNPPARGGPPSGGGGSTNQSQRQRELLRRQP